MTASEIIPNQEVTVEEVKHCNITNCANAYDKSIRQIDAPKMNFLDLSTENSAINIYGPAMMQKNHFESKDYMKHFIHSGKGGTQSSCAVKRMCGVSYIKKTESKQIDVRQKGY